MRTLKESTNNLQNFNERHNSLNPNSDMSRYERRLNEYNSRRQQVDNLYPYVIGGSSLVQQALQPQYFVVQQPVENIYSIRVMSGNVWITIDKFVADRRTALEVHQVAADVIREYGNNRLFTLWSAGLNYESRVNVSSSVISAIRQRNSGVLESRRMNGYGNRGFNLTVVVDSYLAALANSSRDGVTMSIRTIELLDQYDQMDGRETFY